MLRLPRTTRFGVIACPREQHAPSHHLDLTDDTSGAPDNLMDKG